MIKDFIDLADFSPSQLRMLLERAAREKQLFRDGKLQPSLKHRTLAMVFAKPSLRTRVSFETAMTHLGGHAICLAQTDIGLATREPTKDVARVAGRMCDGIMVRTFEHSAVLEMAAFSAAPVINALTDYNHPCQAMADMMTAMEVFAGACGDLAGRKLLFVGDGNNVARSLAVACAKLDMRFTLAAPRGYELSESFVSSLPAGAVCELVRDPLESAGDADIIYTDTWTSMGQEDQKKQRIKDFSGFQVNSALLAEAPNHAIVMHCLPAYRGYEITEEVFEQHAQTIFDEAENRLHFQRALLNVLLGDGGIA